jgi:hypothetical protein
MSADPLYADDSGLTENLVLLQSDRSIPSVIQASHPLHDSREASRKSGQHLFGAPSGIWTHLIVMLIPAPTSPSALAAS